MGFIGGILRSILLTDFAKAGFTSNSSNEPPGWLSRDGHNDDWIYWSTATNQMYRKQDGHELENWEASPETKAQCLNLGRLYAQRIGMKLE